MRNRKLWQGRFEGSTDPLVERFTASIQFDNRLAPYDIAGSIAHCRMLAAQKIIPSGAARKIIRALKAIEKEIARGRFPLQERDEDIHMAIERRVIAKVGPDGGYLHTARSRNDQVALDLRMYVRDAIREIGAGIVGLQRSIEELARANADVLVPGYTHLQRAQPLLLAHHLLAYREMLGRDRERLRDCAKRVNVLPLGAGALAGTTFAIDPKRVAKELGFTRVAANSVDAVSDRDFVIEFLAACAILAAHLSRLAEEIVIWASSEFSFVRLPDAFATGSSMMPQKRNPDVAELVRGKCGRVYGNLIALLTILKGLPLSYNRDLQEDKEPLFDTVDTVSSSLRVLAAMLPRIEICRERLRQAVSDPALVATDIADYLVRKGLAFRRAHEIVGKLMRFVEKEGLTLSDLSLEQWRSFCPNFGPDIAAWTTAEAAVARRAAPGGTAPNNVRKQLSARTR